MQTFISRGRVESFSLIADMLYVGDNAPRLARALFEIAMRNQWVGTVALCLDVTKMLDKRLWHSQHPLWQFPTLLEDHYVTKLERFGLTPDTLYDMEASVRLPPCPPNCMSPAR